MNIFDTVADLKLATLPIDQVVRTRGYFAVDDGGGAEYSIVASATVDSFSDHSLAGATFAILRVSGNLDALQFGIKVDGVTDDQPAIQAAIDKAKLSKVDVLLPTGVIAIEAQLDLVNATGVKLIGQGGGFFVDSGGSDAPTKLLWVGGSSSSAMIRIRSEQSALFKTFNSGVIGIYIDCNSLLARGIYMTSVGSCVIEDVTINEPGTTGLLMDCLDNKLNNGASGSDPADNQNNHIDRLSIKSSLGTCIFLAGNEGTGSTRAANTSLNYFGQIHLNIRDNEGFIFNFSDSNVLEFLRVFRPDSNTGTGLRFDQDDSGQNKHARHNFCYHIQTSRGGVKANAGTGVQPSEDNVIIGFDLGNTGINNMPIIEAGATLSYISSRMIKNLGGQFVAAAATTDTGLADKLETEIAALTTESLRVYNASSNHVKLVTDSIDWTMRIDNGTGNLEMIGGAGANTFGLLGVPTGASVGAAGGATALPATPLGYLTIAIGGSDRKIPFYNT